VQNFIVLGYIPGTQIQITFLGWLGIVACLVGVYALIAKLPSKKTTETMIIIFSERYKQWLSEPVILGNRSVY
jgi:hypothetical protein